MSYVTDVAERSAFFVSGVLGYEFLELNLLYIFFLGSHSDTTFKGVLLPPQFSPMSRSDLGSGHCSQAIGSTMPSSTLSLDLHLITDRRACSSTTAHMNSTNLD